MNILYTCDNNYVWQMGISLVSLLENNKNSQFIRIFFIGKDIAIENKNKLFSIVHKYNRELQIIDAETIKMSDKVTNNGRWPEICYVRLYAYKVLDSSIDRLLYIDCDTIILEDISGLFSDDYADKAIYGVKDFVGDNYKKLIGLSKASLSINGGVILFNLNEYRQLQPDYRIDAFLERYSKRISYADQDVLNGTFASEIGSLSPQYDVMSIMRCCDYSEILKLKHPHNCCSKDEVEAAISHPMIIHFTGNYRYTRPWFENSNHPYTDYFNQYKSVSPWSDMRPIVPNKLKGEIAIANKIRILPDCISVSILGLLYCYIRPASIWVKSLFI